MNTHTDVVLAFLRAMEAKDFAVALTLVADDVTYTNGPMGTFSGPDGIRAVLEPFFSPMTSQQFIIKSTAESGHTVHVERLDRHEFSGKWVELPVAGVFTVEHGLISAWTEYFDAATIVNAMAAL